MDKQKAYEIVKSLGEMAITMHKEVDPDQQPIKMHLGSTLLIGMGAYRKFEMEGHDKQLDQAYAIISDELVDHLYKECWDELTAQKNNA